VNLRVPQNVGKFLGSCTTDGFSRRAQLHGVNYLIAIYPPYILFGLKILMGDYGRDN
jgi:hypothetical protein